MEIRRMKLADLTPADYNPRVALKPGDPEYEALKTSIQTDGSVIPIVWNEETGRIVGGHQKLRVLMDLGETETEVSVVHMNETQERQANVALNRVEGDWDEEKLHDLFAEFDTEDIFSTGFSEAELHTIYPEGFQDGGSDIFKDEDEEEEESPAGSESGGDFTVFLSFPTKETAEEWLRSEGYEPEFTAGRNMIIHMETEGQSDGN